MTRTREPEPGSAIDHLDPPSRKFVWSATLSLFTITGFFRFTYKYFDDVAHREAGTFLQRLVEEATGTYAAAALFVVIVAFVWRFPIDRPGWRRRIPAHLGVMLAYSITHTTLLYVSRTLIAYAAVGRPYDYGYLPARYVMEFGNDAVSYLYFLAIITLYRYYRTTRQREIRTAQLERGLAQAELRNLRLQLQPHFLFNALNTISSTMYEDPRSADRMVGQLSQLLRLSLRTSQQQEVPLRDELEVLECYLGLMRARFGKRLTANVVTAPEALDARVPSLLLQPLVENAIRHGNASHASGGAIEVSVKRVGSMLDIDIHDDGPGAPHGIDVYGRGVGLSSTRDRLQLLYGTAHRFEARNRNGGFAVSIALPFTS
jgi:signal transduction histidine kinase